MKVDFEKIFLGIVFFVLILVGVGILFDHQIKHPFPYAHFASDTFQHQVRTESIKLMGGYSIEAPYIVSGYTDNVGFYPPSLYHIGIIFSNVAGLDTWDGAYMLVFFFTSIAALVMYYIIKRWNKKVAILSLPFSVLVFHAAPMVGFTWGHWPAVTAQAFLIAFFWSLSRLSMERSYVLIGLTLTGIILTHTAELFFGMIFLVVFFGAGWLSKEITKKGIKNIVLGGMISFVLSFYYLVIFNFTWAQFQAYSFYVLPNFGNAPFLQLRTFGILAFFLIGGIVLALLSWKSSKHRTAFLVGAVMLGTGYMNYAGFGQRAFQIRFFWPIYLSVFMGFSIHYLIKFFGKKLSNILTIGVALFILVALNVGETSSFLPRTAKISSPGIMNAQHWQMFEWFQDNTDLSDKVLFLYGDIYGQNAVLRNAQVPPAMVKFDDYFQAIQNRTLQRRYIIQLLGDHHGVYYAYRNSFFDFQYRANELGSDYYYETERDICDWDYIVVDKVSRQAAVAQYNVLLANELFKSGNFREVFSNQVTSVIQNTQPGEDCFPEEGVQL